MNRVGNVLGRGGFHVKGWVMSGVTGSTVSMPPESTGVEKVLGLIWNSKTDRFVFKLKPPPPFYNTSVDLFRPRYVNDLVNYDRTQLQSARKVTAPLVFGYTFHVTSPQNTQILTLPNT